MTAVEAIQRSPERPRLVFFYSPVSGKSRRTEGYLAQVLQRRRNHETFSVVRVDADKRPDLAGRFRVTELPTLIVIDGHRVRGRLSEPTGCRQITELLRPWLS
jgi:thioredoxin-like negative regulator of GroEL